MADIIWGIIFIVIFYNVFRFIWTHVTTVSYNGLEGFFKSWGSQVIWAFIITAIIITIIAKILDSIFSFGRGLNVDFFDVLIFGGVAYVIFAIFSSSEDAFDKKTFRENYNNYVDSFGRAARIYDRMSDYKSSAEPGDKIAEGITSEVRQGTPLNLTEEFLTNENGVKLINFPNATALYSDEDNEPHIIFMIDLWGDVNNSIERIFIDIIITAAIAAVEPGKSDEIKRELKLINDDEPIFYLPPYNPEEKSENMFLAVSKATYNFSRFEDFVTFSIYIHK
ncbi:MAG: hypothetical protein IKI08_00725 [Selenomonadaceae bacterium]|nr:hypothetical protein [Selenomonadaceae bacterium]